MRPHTVNNCMCAMPTMNSVIRKFLDILAIFVKPHPGEQVRLPSLLNHWKSVHGVEDVD